MAHSNAHDDHSHGRADDRRRLSVTLVLVATYLVAHLQERTAQERIGRVLDQTGFWGAVARDPFDRQEWIEAIRVAPTMKKGFHTVLSERDRLDELVTLIDDDPRLADCFTR